MILINGAETLKIMTFISMINEPALAKEIRYRTSRSSGSGGQHVNKVETRVEAIFNINTSTALSENQVRVVLHKLSRRINAMGELIVSSSKTKSQSQNKTEAANKLMQLISTALKVDQKRIPTKIPYSVKRERLQNKRAVSEKKSRRRYDASED